MRECYCGQCERLAAEVRRLREILQAVRDNVASHRAQLVERIDDALRLDTGGK